MKSKVYFLILTVASMLAVLSASIAVPLLCRPFYYAHVSLLDLPAQTGWSTAEIHQAFNEMMDYCLLGAPFGTGVLRWSQEGLAHFADCAVLFRLDLGVLLLSLFVLLLCTVAYRRGLRPARPLQRGASFWSGSILAAVFLLTAALAATNFDRAFVIFHKLFFPGKDNWLFDPATDEIILVLPQVFFRNCAILIVAVLLLCCLGMILYDLTRSRKKK